MGCAQSKEQENNSDDVFTTQIEPDSLKLTAPHMLESAGNEQLPDCAFDSLRFMASMGKGVAEIHHNMAETAYYNGADLTDSLGKLFLDNRLLYIQFQKDTFPIDWFLYPTEYRAGSVISLHNQNNALQLKVKGLPDSLACWIEKKQIDEGRHMIQFVDWSTYLSRQTLWITEAQLRKNPIRSLPNNMADTITFDFTYPVFKLHEYKNPWLLLSTLTYKSTGRKGSSDTMSAPIGWYKWYCNDTVQLFIPSFYDLEYFYSPGYKAEE